jgi:G3E family GTPase
MSEVRMIVVGGFLGAGKTTLLARAAEHLISGGLRVGIITNDQAADLVDTELFKGKRLAVSEVAGGCFCCRFSDLAGAATRLLDEVRPDFLLCEPVGSCTDISATVLQPVKWLWDEWAELAPFSVLADPHRLSDALRRGPEAADLPESVYYIFRKQLEEADYIVINKSDMISPRELADLTAETAAAYPDAVILEMSALQDRGVKEWLTTVRSKAQAGRRILEVDYDTYAQGEAVLGWLNASASLAGPEDTDWNGFVLEIMDRIHAQLIERKAEIAHVKLFLSTSTGFLVANITGNKDIPSVRGHIGTGTPQTSLVVNARVHIGPDILRQIVETAISAATRDIIEVLMDGIRSFSPSYPKPMHRFDKVKPSKGV